MSPPTETELASRIQTHLEFTADKYAATLIWKGILAGLYEWDVIPLEVYTRLGKLLPGGGEIGLAEYFNGEPLSPEMTQKLEEDTAERPI